MGTFRLRVSAENDLYEIGLEGRTRWGDAQMHRYLKGLDDAFHALADMPELGRVCADFPRYRRFVVRNHVIFYARTEQDQVDVVRILHGRMDPQLHLDADED